MDRAPRDEEIRANYITFIDATGQMVEKRMPLKRALGEFNRDTYFLVQVGSGSIPVCRLFEKKALFEQQKAKKKSKQTKSPEAVVKEITLGWNVSDHDLEHKLRHAKQFLDKGNKVKVEIANKRGQVRLTRDEQKQYVDRITTQFVDYKPTKPPAFQGGGTCIMQFEKK